MNLAVSVQGVTRDFTSGTGRTTVLRGVDLEVADGEMVSIMGPSGSGKSTLLHLIGGLDRPTGGRVVVAGHDLATLNARQLADLRARHLGFVFQSFNLLAGLTAIENVALPAVLLGERPSWFEPRARDLLDRVGLVDVAERHPAELSGGEQQRVAVARALLMDPALVIADEPTGNLDTKTGNEVLGLFEESHRQGRTVLLVSHDPRVASRAERIVVLRDGAVDDEFDTASAAPPIGRRRLGSLLEIGER